MKKSIILSILALIVVFAALLLFAGDKKPAPKAVPPPSREMTRAPDPAPAIAEAAPVEDAALKDALLGLNKKPEMVEPQPAPAPRTIRRRAVQAVDEPEDEVEEEITGLSDFDFQSTVGGWSGVKSCIATVSQRDRLSGALQVAFTIRANGNVVESKVVGASNDDARTLAPCVEKQARHIRFPTFAGNDDVTKTAKFVF